MALIKPIKQIKVGTFEEFCSVFNVTTHKIAGEFGTDEELIVEELNKDSKTSWLMNFIDTKQDGYFLLQQIIN